MSKGGTRYRARPLRIFVMMGLWLATVGGCGSDAPAAPDLACTRGETRRCSSGCPEGGMETCDGSPPQWGDCVCDDPEMDAGPAPKPRLGGPCDEDADCPGEAFCSSEDDSAYFGGAPPEGVCVADCTSSAAVCEGFRSARCVDVTPRREGRQSGEADAGVRDAGTSDAGVLDAGHDAGGDDAAMPDAGGVAGRALCFRGCTVGASENACGDAAEQACEPLAEGESEGFCRPLCTTDADCGARHCHRRHGACVDVASAGSSLGETCDPEAPGAVCDGLCVEVGEDAAYCSYRCRFGNTDLCTALDTEVPGACLLVTPGGSLGDIGFCGLLCDCNDDCSAQGTACVAFADAALEERFQAQGACRAVEEASSGIPCGDS